MRLKDKEWHFKTIIINKLVAQYKGKWGTTNEPICFLVTIKDNGTRVMFRADSVTQLFKLIKNEGRIYL